MIQEITAQGRNLEEMNVKAEMHHNVLWKNSEEALCQTAPVFCQTHMAE